ncbi:hypothetical protein SAMN04488067_102214 [Halorubrum xinjiangense]|uniref:Uncharacterized protein n=1 Tax=Halorubrum xinjiangense TaxID=261291 RepID=A0A1G7IYK3_9EURY|nr:hypothetical protein [Halorubrum xinjiangense]SDF17379.1 hypothetical protein SAMN04488067_102214 [Halorubrum xinjiangense]
MEIGLTVDMEIGLTVGDDLDWLAASPARSAMSGFLVRYPKIVA